MQFLRRNNSETPPRVSFVLLDWSVRESLHTLDYLADQDVDRDKYEILWIEYYEHVHPELKDRVTLASLIDEPPPVDSWIAMGMPSDVCHHKHLMYNVGLLTARGELVCFCDSDAMMRPRFVRSILDAFTADSNIVLHHDEVRNHSPRFHPFRYPAFEDVTGPGCNNWVNGRTLGLWDEHDPLHTRNYGACMTARREDLIAIGGADMHTDYLGHVCGPYEMTFRLVNHGCREVWHETEFLYHTWHPGQAGSMDHCGPHDGQHMSTTALETRETKRVQPLEEHPAIAIARRPDRGRIEGGELIANAVKPEWLSHWRADHLHKLAGESNPPTTGRSKTFQQQFGLLDQLQVAPLVMRMLVRQFRIKQRKASLAAPHPAGPQPSLLERMLTAPLEVTRKLRAASRFLPRAVDYNKYVIRLCWTHLALLKSQSCREFMIAGEGIAADVIRRLSKLMGLHVRGAWVRDSDGLRFRGDNSRDGDSWDGPVIIAELVESKRYDAALRERGVDEDRIIRLA